MSFQWSQFEYQTDTDGPHLLITGGVHGDEFEPIAAIRRLRELWEKNDSRISKFRGRLTLVPVVNHSAFLRGHRCGEDGLDLARTCPGRPDGSITEQVAHELSELIRSADYYVDLHTGGTELSVYPLCGYVMHSSPQVLEIQRRMARAFNLPVVWGTAANLPGRSLSVARDAHVPAVYCEYLGAATCHTAGVEAYVEGCLNVMAELGMLPRERPESRVKHVVENPAPDSGHMQICNPSPIAGYWETHVQLGESVRSEQRLGMVYPLDESRPAVITATETGIIVVLRTFPRVQAGDSVGVVMELP